MTPESKHQAAVGLWQSIPSAGAVAIWLAGISIEKWAALAGILFIGVQIGYLAWRWRRDVKRERERLKRGTAPPTTDKGDL